jgi:hypothetical protein
LGRACSPVRHGRRVVIGFVVGPGSDFAEEPVVQVRAGHAGDRVVPEVSCPGPLVIE